MVVERQTGLKRKNAPHTNNRDENKRRGPPYKSAFPPGGRRKQNKKTPKMTQVRCVRVLIWRQTYLKQKIGLSATIDDQPKNDKRKQAEGHHCCTVLKLSTQNLHCPSLLWIDTISNSNVAQKNLALYQWQTCVVFEVKSFIFYSSQKLLIHGINLLSTAVHSMWFC